MPFLISAYPRIYPVVLDHIFSSRSFMYPTSYFQTLHAYPHAVPDPPRISTRISRSSTHIYPQFQILHVYPLAVPDPPRISTHSSRSSTHIHPHPPTPWHQHSSSLKPNRFMCPSLKCSPGFQNNRRPSPQLTTHSKLPLHFTTHLNQKENTNL